MSWNDPAGTNQRAASVRNAGRGASGGARSAFVIWQVFRWQSHSVRGMISILGKTHKVESSKVDGARTYWITK